MNRLCAFSRINLQIPAESFTYPSSAGFACRRESARTRVDPFKHRVPAHGHGMRARRLAHFRVLRWIAEDARDRRRKTGILDDATGHSVADDGLRAPSGVTIAGTPLANASSTTFPNVSVCEGNTNKSMFA